VGVPGNWHAMNTVKLFKDTGDLLLDFDQDHVTKKLNLKTEILKK
jgi:chaperonin cofactor prefoldin